jgi:hypothetical protein
VGWVGEGGGEGDASVRTLGCVCADMGVRTDAWSRPRGRTLFYPR